MNDSIMGRLQAMADRLSPTDRIIASYFVENQARLIDLTMPQIAEACQVSKPAMVRLCKKMGFTGYKALLTALSAEIALRGKPSANAQPLTSLAGLDAAAICDLSARLAIEIIQDTRRSLSVKQMEKACELLINCRSLVILGWDHAAINVMDAQMKYARLGFQTASAQEAYSRNLMLRSLRPGDVVMLFTTRGYCADGHLALGEVHRRGADAVIITTDAQGYDLAPGDVLFSSSLKGHLPGTDDADHTLAGNLVMTTLHLIVGMRLSDLGRLPAV